MKPSIAYIGAHRSPIVVIDDFSGDVRGIVDVASALAPFPEAETFYPGLRRLLGRQDSRAWGYVERTMNAVAGFVGRGFGSSSFDLLEASFSLVTQPPDALLPLQRIPHFDSIDPGYLAILHYLGGTEGTGTAFFRHRSTGIERVTHENRAEFTSAAHQDAMVSAGYIASSNPHFAQVAFIPAAPDRLVIYQGSLLHSGLIAPGFNFSAHPSRGRLTANLFVRAT